MRCRKLPSKVIKHTRKDHKCFFCDETILKGSPAIYTVVIIDGDFVHTYSHIDLCSRRTK